MSSVVFDVPDVSCEHCERAITAALRPLEGVGDVHVDIPGRTVTVAFDEAAIDVERLKAVMAAEDYPVAGVM